MGARVTQRAQQEATDGPERRRPGQPEEERAAATGHARRPWDDLDSDITVNAIVAALEACGHRATFLEGNLSLVETLPRLKPDICFNICEGHWGDSREAHVPALLEMLRIPYTGAGADAGADPGQADDQARAGASMACPRPRSRSSSAPTSRWIPT